MLNDTAIIILAAGQGRRLGRGNKALLPLGGRALLSHSTNAARNSQCLGQLILVMNPEDLQALESEWGITPQDLGVDDVVAGGPERWLSSQAGLSKVAPEMEYVLVHDCARALVSADIFDNVATEVRQHGCALAAQQIADTIKRSGPDQRVAETVARESMWAAQTPQGAKCALLKRAFEQWPAANPVPTDEAMLLEAIGEHPCLVPSNTPNFKVTTPTDFATAAAILELTSKI